MARRPRRPGPSPAGMLAFGSNWLDDEPTFDAATPADQEALRYIHATARALAKRREELNVSQTWVAKWSAVTRQTVAAIEDGTTWPDHLTVLKVAATLGYTLTLTPGLVIGPRPGSKLATTYRPKNWN